MILNTTVEDDQNSDKTTFEIAEEFILGVGNFVGYTNLFLIFETMQYRLIINLPIDIEHEDTVRELTNKWVENLQEYFQDG